MREGNGPVQPGMFWPNRASVSQQGTVIPCDCERSTAAAMAKEGDGGGEREAAEGSIVWREEARRFETPDGKAYLQYRLLAQHQQPRSSSSGDGGATAAPAVMDLVHTYVPGSKRGQGLAARLCDAAFAHARRHGMRVVPTCSYISDTYLPRNPAWNELVLTEKAHKTSSM